MSASVEYQIQKTVYYFKYSHLVQYLYYNIYMILISTQSNLAANLCSYLPNYLLKRPPTAS